MDLFDFEIFYLDTIFAQEMTALEEKEKEMKAKEVSGDELRHNICQIQCDKYCQPILRQIS